MCNIPCSSNGRVCLTKAQVPTFESLFNGADGPCFDYTNSGTGVTSPVCLNFLLWPFKMTVFKASYASRRIASLDKEAWEAVTLSIQRVATILYQLE